VRIVEASSSATQAKLLNRQGAGLAGITLLADSLAGAVLAAGAAVMGLVVASRRRRYEYEALIATGASRRTLRSGLLIEQAAVLLFGAVAGIVAGLLAALLVLRSIPEFVTTPESFPLRYVPDARVLSITVAVTICTLLLVAVLASAAMVAGLRGERLREAAP
jgi:ABC-type antimicrobial peptide transport system permease subunit